MMETEKTKRIEMSERFYVAMSKNNWGKGISLIAAANALKDITSCAWVGEGIKGEDMVIYKLPSDVHSVSVTGTGAIVWDVLNKADVNVRTEKVKELGERVVDENGDDWE